MTDKKTMSWLLHIAGEYKKYIGSLMFLYMFVNGGAVCYALIMKQMVDSAVGQNRKGFFGGLVLFGLVMLVLMLVRIILRQIEENVRSSIENNLKERLFEQLLKRDYAQVSMVHSEEWMNRMTSDASVCANGMTDILPGIMGMTVRMAGALFLMFLLQPKLSYIVIPSGIVFIGITLVIRRYLKEYHKRVQEKDGEVRVYLQEHISSMLILRTFGVEKEALFNAGKELAKYREIRLKKAFFSNLCSSGFSAAMNGMYLIGIGYCGYGILKGEISYGTLTAITQLIGQLQVPLSGISGFVPRFYAMLASAERLMEIENYKEACTEKIKTSKEASIFYDTEMEKIVFEKVSFAYKKETDSILKEASLTLNKGDYAAIIGASGCGKSTLLKLFMGIYQPQKGNITVVTKEGGLQSIDSLRRLFAYVPQGNYLMSGTIREVITFGKEACEETGMTIEESIRLACAEFIFELPEKSNTVLGENGAGLSEGQMQRIAIARALYTNAPILILDEATSALDSETEEQLLFNLKHLTDKTVFIVTHKMEALKICNRKFVFANGKMKEQKGRDDESYTL